MAGLSIRRCVRLVFGFTMGLVVSLSGLNLAAAPPLSAQSSGFNLITSPLPINLSGPPGSVLTTDLKLKNGSTKTERLKLSLMKFSAYGEDGKPAIKDREKGDDYFDWVSFYPSELDAPPNVWQTVKMTITLPKTAAFGYYYAAVISRADQPTKADNKTNSLIGSTAILVLVDAVVPGAKREAKLTSFTTSKGIYEFLPANFSIKLNNSGNTHLVPTGNIFITKGNKTIATLSVNEAKGNILPNSNRIYTTSWSDGFPLYQTTEQNGQVILGPNNQAKTSLKWDFSKASKLRFGHYQAKLTLIYDNGQRDVPLEATVGFWVVPFRVILYALAIPIVPSVLVYILMKRRFKKRLAKSTSKAQSPTEKG